MSAKIDRIGIAAACLVTLMHSPAGTLTFGVLPSATPDRCEAPTANATQWFRPGFLLPVPAAAWPAEPTDGGLWTGPEPTAPPAPPAVPTPATVQNVRRPDAS